MGAVSAQAEQAVQLHLLIVLLHGGDLVYLVLPHHPHELEGGAPGAQDGAAHGEDAGELPGLHDPPVPVDQAVIAVCDADDLHPVPHALVQRLGDAPQRGVETRAVSAGGEDTHSFFHWLYASSFLEWLRPLFFSIGVWPFPVKPQRGIMAGNVRKCPALVA